MSTSEERRIVSVSIPAQTVRVLVTFDHGAPDGDGAATLYARDALGDYGWPGLDHDPLRIDGVDITNAEPDTYGLPARISLTTHTT